MHPVVLDSLEEFLSGALEPVKRRQVDAHLVACASCREEIHGMQEVSQLFGSLRSEEVFEPSPGFFNGVMQQVRSQKAAPSFSGLFSLDFAFARRLVFASLMTPAEREGQKAEEKIAESKAVEQQKQQKKAPTLMRKGETANPDTKKK